jgi:hypothetical protein
MIEAIENVAKEFAAAIFDLIEWAWHKVVAPQG